jgi:Na+/citrate or Na+/malate symporter
MVMGKAGFALAGALAGVLVATQWKDITRYVKIELMSSGDGHPGVVPASGSHR